MCIIPHASCSDMFVMTAAYFHTQQGMCHNSSNFEFTAIKSPLTIPMLCFRAGNSSLPRLIMLPATAMASTKVKLTPTRSSQPRNMGQTSLSSPRQQTGVQMMLCLLFAVVQLSMEPCQQKTGKIPVQVHGKIFSCVFMQYPLSASCAARASTHRYF